MCLGSRQPSAVSRQPSAIRREGEASQPWSTLSSCSTQKADAVSILEVKWKQAGDRWALQASSAYRRQELTGVKSKRLEASRVFSGCRAVKRAPLLWLIERSRGRLCKILQAPPPHFLFSVRMCRRVCTRSATSCLQTRSELQ